MGDQHAVSVGAAVPALLLDVLHHEVFVRVAAVFDAIRLAAVGGGGEGYGLLFVEYLNVHPAEELLFIGCVAAGGVAAFVVAAIVHDAPGIHAEVARVACVVEVGQAEAVAEFVADGADSVDLAAGIAVELATAGVLVHLNAVELHSGACAAGELPLMGPDGVCVSVMGFAITSIDNVAEVHYAVIVRVVVAEVDIGVGQLQHIGYQLGGILVAASFIVTAVELHGVGCLIGSPDVELGGKLAV